MKNIILSNLFLVLLLLLMSACQKKESLIKESYYQIEDHIIPKVYLFEEEGGTFKMYVKVSADSVTKTLKREFYECSFKVNSFSYVVWKEKFNSIGSKLIYYSESEFGAAKIDPAKENYIIKWHPDSVCNYAFDISWYEEALQEESFFSRNVKRTFTNEESIQSLGNYDMAVKFSDEHTNMDNGNSLHASSFWEYTYFQKPYGCIKYERHQQSNYGSGILIMNLTEVLSEAEWEKILMNFSQEAIDQFSLNPDFVHEK